MENMQKKTRPRARTMFAEDGPMRRARQPLRLALAILAVSACSNSEGSGGGCGSSGYCDINATATLCGDLITLECFDGAEPDAASQCELALEQDTESVYCCTSAVETEGAGFGDGGGAMMADGFGGADGLGGDDGFGGGGGGA